MNKIAKYFKNVFSRQNKKKHLSIQSEKTISDEYLDIKNGASASIVLNNSVLIMYDAILEIIHLDGNVIKILLWCLKYSTIDHNTAICYLSNNKILKDNIRKDGSTLDDSTINKGVHLLCKNGFLIRKSFGYYVLNPKYFSKGKCLFHDK